jgi:DNA-binding LytR/AlgR family response regulator
MAVKKLKCVLVDDDDSIHKLVQDLCQESTVATLTKRFDCPKKFLQEQAKLDYDLCLLDINSSALDGVLVAQLLNGKPVIFVTGMNERLNDAVDFGPIDILLKPIKRDRFNSAIDKAEAIIRRDSPSRIKARPSADMRERKYELFNVADSNEKVRVSLSDIFLVTTDVDNARNKRIVMRSGEKHTLMYCNFEYLLSIAPQLMRVNKSDLVSEDAVLRFKHDIIILKVNNEKGSPRYITLNRAYREEFMKRISI